MVSADALHTQRENAPFFVEDKHAHYLITVKDNQPRLYDVLRNHPWSSLSPLRAETVECAHGRIDIRAIRTTTTLNPELDFPHVAQVACIERLRITLKTGKCSDTRAYAVTTQSPAQATPEQLLEQVRVNGPSRTDPTPCATSSSAEGL